MHTNNAVKEEDLSSTGTLYLVSVPIGNPEDITLRAIRVLKEVDYVICEERKCGSQLLKQLGIQKELILFNEHTPAEEVYPLTSLLLKGLSLALISDVGTPVFADPGTPLVHAAIRAECAVVPVPGASSLMAALVCYPFGIKEFHYVGFLPRKPEERSRKLKSLAKLSVPLVIYEAPYRLIPLIESLVACFGPSRDVMIGISLTFPEERFFRGSLKEALQQFQTQPIKEPFVLIC